MRWVLLPFVLAPCSLFGQAIFSENFDSLHVGDRIAASDPVHWRTWSGATGTNEDAPVTDTLAYSPPNSLAFVQQIGGYQGGPEDQVLLLGYHLWGSYTLSWRMYVPTGRGAFMVLMHGEDIPGAEPAAVITFYPTTYPGNNPVRCYAGGSQMDSYCYPQNTWFTVALAMDLDARTASLTVNDSTLGPWDFDTMPNGSPSQNILGSLRLTSGSGIEIGIGQYYIDDILFQEGTVGIQDVVAAGPLAMVPNPTVRNTVLSMEVPPVDAQVVVNDASGRIVLQRAWPQGSNQCTLQTDLLAPGTYIVRVASVTSRASTTSAAAPGTGVYSGRLVVLP